VSPIVDVNEATQLPSGTVLAVPLDADDVIGPLGEQYVRSNADGYLTAVNEDYFDLVLASIVDSDGKRVFAKDTNIGNRSYVTKFYVGALEWGVDTMGLWFNDITSQDGIDSTGLWFDSTNNSVGVDTAFWVEA
jgi:hypothetical protein